MYDTIIRIVADGFIVAIFLIAMAMFVFRIPRKEWFRKGWRIVAAGLTTYIAAKLIGAIYQPETLRPFEKLGVDPGATFLPNPGFPSDHALFAMFLTLAVWFAVRDRRLTILMVILTGAMAAARVLALVHTPLDVIGGIAIAGIGVIWYGRLPEKVVQYFQSYKKH